MQTSKMFRILLLFAGLITFAAAVNPTGGHWWNCGLINARCLTRCGGYITPFCWSKCKAQTIKEDKSCSDFDFGSNKDHWDPYDPFTTKSKTKTKNVPRATFITVPSAQVPHATPVTRVEHVTCDDCYHVYERCVKFAGVKKLPCEAICRKRACQTDDICKDCGNGFFKCHSF